MEVRKILLVPSLKEPMELLQMNDALLRKFNDVLTVKQSEFDI